MWRHVGTFDQGSVYNPSTMKDMYSVVSDQVRRPCPNEHGPALGHLGQGRWEPEASRRHGCGLHPRPETSHDLGVELDLVRNDVRYGPSSPQRCSIAIHGDGVQKCVGGRLGYVAVAPFSTLSTANFLNSGEWTFMVHTTNRHCAVAVVHVPSEQRTPNCLDVGWNREVCTRVHAFPNSRAARLQPHRK